MSYEIILSFAYNRLVLKYALERLEFYLRWRPVSSHSEVLIEIPQQVAS